MKILATKSYRYLAKNLLQQTTQKNFHISEIMLEQKKFPDSELYLKILEPTIIRGDSVIILCGVTNFEAAFELYNFACEIVTLGCSVLHIVIPYLAYSAQERAHQAGEIITVKNIARLLSAIPKANHGNHIYLVDVHDAIIQKFFDSDVHISLISTKNLIKKVIMQILANQKTSAKNVESTILASVDTGRAKIVNEIANELGLERTIIIKERISPQKTQIISVLNENITDKIIIIYDDMIRTGESLLNAAKYFRTVGAKKIFAIISHGIFSAGALKKIEQSQLIDKIICFNTHPNIFMQTPHNKNFLTICDISEILLENLY